MRAMINVFRMAASLILVALIILGIILIINCVTQVSSAISSNAKTIVDGIIDKVIYPGDIDIDSVNSITGGIVFGPIE